MTENIEYNARPCSVCAALVPMDDMDDHLEWHDSLTEPVGRPAAPGAEADPGISDV